MKTYADKNFEPYIATWMKTVYPSPACSTPLPSNHAWLKKFNTAVGDPDEKAQAYLAKSMQLNNHAGVGELIWAMTKYLPLPVLNFCNLTLVLTNSISTVKACSEIPLCLSGGRYILLAHKSLVGTPRGSRTYN